MWTDKPPSQDSGTPSSLRMNEYGSFKKHRDLMDSIPPLPRGAIGRMQVHLVLARLPLRLQLIGRIITLHFYFVIVGRMIPYLKQGLSENIFTTLHSGI